MQRRKLLIGIGTAVGAGAVGTGAFTSVSAERDVTVQVADDADALLGIETGDGPNASAFAETTTDGTVALDFSETSAGGSGLGTDSEYQFDDILRLTNQGTQTVYAWVTFDFSDADDDLTRGDVYFYPQSNADRELNDGENSVLTLPVGESVSLGLFVDTEAVSGEQSLSTTINADVDVPSGSQPRDGSGEDAAVVTGDPNDGEFDSIQSAVEEVDGTTVFVEPETFEESVVVDKPITIRGTTDPKNGDAATVVGQGSDTFTVRSDAVTISRLDVQNPGGRSGVDPGSFAGATGVRVESGNTGVSVVDNVITGLGTENDDANPMAVYAEGATSGVRVENNQIAQLSGTDEDQGAVQAIHINSQRKQEGIDSGIDDVRVANNTITDVLDTRSAVAVRFNGDVSGEIVGNTISDLNTEGDIPGTNDPGGFTQVLALSKGGNSTTGPSDVTIKGNDISNIETTTADNFAPPYHIIVGQSASDINITGNDLTADSQDTEVFVEDRSSGSPSLNEVLNNNVFNPEAVAGENRIVPLQTESGGLFANLGTDGIAPLQAGTKLSEFPTGSGDPFGLDGEFMQPIYANKTDESISIDVVSNRFGPTDLELNASSYNEAAFAGSNQWTRIPIGSGTPYPLKSPETAWDSSGNFQGGPISGGPNGDYELVEISETDDGFRVVWEFLGTEQNTAQDAGFSSQTVEQEADQPPEEDAEAY